jgi:hypothetical protein
MACIDMYPGNSSLLHSDINMEIRPSETAQLIFLPKHRPEHILWLLVVAEPTLRLFVGRVLCQASRILKPLCNLTRHPGDHEPSRPQ